MLGFSNVCYVTKTTGNGCNIDGCITTTNNHNFLRRTNDPTFVEGVEEFYTVDAVFRAFPTRNWKRATLLCAKCPENSIVVSFECFNGNVFTNCGVQVNLNAHFGNAANFNVQHVTWGTVARDTIAHHTAKFAVRIVKHNFMASAAQEVRSR